MHSPKHPNKTRWIPLLQLSGFPNLHEQQVTIKNKTRRRLMQFTTTFSAFAWVRVTTQSHYCTTPCNVFTLLCNLISTGLTAGFGVRVASTRGARSSLALGTRSGLVLRSSAYFATSPRVSSPGYLCGTLDIGRDYTRHRGQAAAPSKLVGEDSVGFRQGFTPDGRSSLSRNTHGQCKRCREPKCFPDET